MSKIVLLNGAGFSGKTLIATGMQYGIQVQWLTFSVDTFIGMTRYPYPGKESEYFDFVAGK